MFRKLVSLGEAKKLLTHYYKPHPIGVETVSIIDSSDRVAAENVRCNVSVPPFDKSLVDGYAVIAEDTFGAEENRPIRLKIDGKILAGDPPRSKVVKGHSVEIATGAQLPLGADAVVMLEYTNQTHVDWVEIYRAVHSGENVLKRGSDISAGSLIVKSKTVLTISQIGLLAASGIDKIKVYRKPKVGILSTGSELIKPGFKLSDGKIFDINTYTLTVAVKNCGCTPIPLGIVSDDEEAMLKIFKKGLKNTDLILSSGATSVGREDVIPKVLNKLGKPGTIINGILVKPGKPTTVAIIRGKPIFALPGHPTAAITIFHILCKPLLHKLANFPYNGKKILAKTSKKSFSARGRETFIPVVLEKRFNEWVAEPIELESGAISTFSKADGFYIIPRDQDFINENEMVEVYLFDKSTVNFQ